MYQITPVELVWLTTLHLCWGCLYHSYGTLNLELYTFLKLPADIYDQADENGFYGRRRPLDHTSDTR